MKIKDLFIYILLFTEFYSYSQSSIRFIDTANKWKTQWHLSGIPFLETRTFFFSGDSIIIEGKYFQTLSYTSQDIDINVIKNSGMHFRQEGVKVFKSYNNTGPHLLYDFNLSIDSALYPSGVPLTLYQKINSIDSIVLDNGNKVKKMNVVCNVEENQNPLSWIEGIGDVTSPFTSEPQCSLLDPNEFETLICFSTNGQVVYQNENFFECAV